MYQVVDGCVAARSWTAADISKVFEPPDFSVRHHTDEQPSQPMSAAISCTRATAPRLAIRTIRCQRYASLQAADAISENREMVVETAPVAKVTTPTPTPAGKGHKNTRAPTLAERMHKALYPDLYVNGRPIEGVQLPKERRAKKAGEERQPRSTSASQHPCDATMTCVLF